VRQVSLLLKSRHVDFAELRAGDELATIAADMRAHGGDHVPTEHWLDAVEKGDNAAAIHDTYTGAVGPVSPALIESFGRFLEPWASLGLWEANILDSRVAARMTEADIRTVMDLELIDLFAPKGERTTILEVGGGYGRVAEGALNVFGDSIRYVLVDAVPHTIHYARLYLEQACPDKRIGAYSNGDPFDLERFDCYIVPAWRFEEVNTATYQVCVNLNSFQEMNQTHVDRYLGWFDEYAEEAALVYLLNARDFLFTGDYNYPASWCRRLCANTPRSWTRDHPAEVFVKNSSRDWTRENALLDAAYERTLDPLLPEHLARLGAKKAAAPVARYFAGRALKKLGR
jgi:hypothetical protein